MTRLGAFHTNPKGQTLAFIAAVATLAPFIAPALFAYDFVLSLN